MSLRTHFNTGFDYTLDDIGMDTLNNTTAGIRRVAADRWYRKYELPAGPLQKSSMLDAVESFEESFDHCFRLT